MAETTPSPVAHTPGVSAVVDHRSAPPGVLPRRGQTWLMVGVAGGIVAIILFTGQEAPPPRAATAPTAAALVPNPEQLRSYQQRLEAADTRPQALPALPELRPVMPEVAMAGQGALRPQDAIAEERQRREYESLFASNVVQSPTLPSEPSRQPALRRGPVGGATDITATPPSLDDVAEAVLRASAARYAEPSAAPAPVAASAAPAAAPPETTAADGPLHRVLEGTLIDTVLTNRLDGTVAAPVNCLVSIPLYTADGQQVLIPAGSRILGTTKPVQSFGETRLAVAFTRLVLPTGRTYTLDRFLGLNAIGDAGLRGQVNQHYKSTFGVSAAVGLISGFGQFLGGGFGNRTSGPVIITGNVGDATAQAAGQTMGRFLNRLPSITIREGHRVKVYLTSDLQLPVYRASPSMPDNGLQLAERVQP